MMQRILIAFEPKQLVLLKRLSRERKKSMSEIVREAMVPLLQSNYVTSGNLVLDSIKEFKKTFKGKKGQADPHLSKKVDEIMYSNPFIFIL